MQRISDAMHQLDVEIFNLLADISSGRYRFWTIPMGLVTFVKTQNSLLFREYTEVMLQEYEKSCVPYQRANTIGSPLFSEAIKKAFGSKYLEEFESEYKNGEGEAYACFIILYNLIMEEINSAY